MQQPQPQPQPSESQLSVFNRLKSGVSSTTDYATRAYDDLKSKISSITYVTDDDEPEKKSVLMDVAVTTGKYIGFAAALAIVGKVLQKTRKGGYRNESHLRKKRRITRHRNRRSN